MIFNEKNSILFSEKYALVKSYRGYDIYAKSNDTNRWYVRYTFSVLPVAVCFYQNLLRGIYRG